MQKSAEVEIDYREHNLVINAIKDLPSERKCYRLVGGVLVERTVGEVLPAVTENIKNLQQLLKELSEQIAVKKKAIAQFAEQYNIQPKRQ
eukprot:TRINITY_DN30567_c0_g1_i2.p2 TRINITY_DN30567_c0_g1~~TRINITY_DN30567_c0_g1_i2.p2  ORF type:complete len:90 (+),score=18.77 TRINITY_DN30567_c0_g1_i2:355-624(+)